MNVEIGAEAALFPEKEYIYGIFVAVLAAASSHPASVCIRQNNRRGRLPYSRVQILLAFAIFMVRCRQCVAGRMRWYYKKMEGPLKNPRFYAVYRLCQLQGLSSNSTMVRPISWDSPFNKEPKCDKILFLLWNMHLIREHGKRPVRKQ